MTRQRKKEVSRRVDVENLLLLDRRGRDVTQSAIAERGFWMTIFNRRRPDYYNHSVEKNVSVAVRRFA